MFSCYHDPFQHAQMGNLYMDIGQPVLSKGWHCNNMQLKHQDTSINYRKYFCCYFYRASLSTDKQKLVWGLAGKDWRVHDYAPSKLGCSLFIDP